MTCNMDTLIGAFQASVGEGMIFSVLSSGHLKESLLVLKPVETKDSAT